LGCHGAPRAPFDLIGDARRHGKAAASEQIDIVRSASISINLFDDHLFDLVRPDDIDELRAISDRMSRAGYASELVQVYCGILLVLGSRRRILVLSRCDPIQASVGLG
jgi:hypothetical protein